MALLYRKATAHMCCKNSVFAILPGKHRALQYTKQVKHYRWRFVPRPPGIYIMISHTELEHARLLDLKQRDLVNKFQQSDLVKCAVEGSLSEVLLDNQMDGPCVMLTGTCLHASFDIVHLVPMPFALFRTTNSSVLAYLYNRSGLVFTQWCKPVQEAAYFFVIQPTNIFACCRLCLHANMQRSVCRWLFLWEQLHDQEDQATRQQQMLTMPGSKKLTILTTRYT